MTEGKDSFIVLYTTKAKPRKEKELRELLIAGITSSRLNEGNISCELHEVADDPTTFVFYERWISQAALDAGIETPALKKLKRRHPS